MLIIESLAMKIESTKELTNSYPENLEISIKEYRQLRQELDDVLRYACENAVDTFMGIPVVIKEN